MGTIFAMRQSQVNEWVHRLSDGLHATLGVDAYLPERDPATLEAVLADCASRELLIDGPERPIQQPRDATRPRAAFRGKKDAHAEEHPRRRFCGGTGALSGANSPGVGA